MKRYLLAILAVVLLGGVAQGGVPGVRTEFGVVAGVDYPFHKFDMGQSAAQIKGNMGFAAGIHMGLRIVGILGVQPEIIYSYHKFSLENSKQQSFSTEVKCNTLQIPLLISLRLPAVRFNLGPVFTVMDNPTYLDKSGEKVMFGRLHPTVSYAVGVSTVLLRKLVVDARVSSGVKSMENFLSYDAKQQGNTIKTTTINAQLKVGVLF